MAAAESGDDQERAYGRGAYSVSPAGSQPPYRSRKPASHTYEAERFALGVSLAFGTVGVLAGIVALVLGEIWGLILLFAGASFAFSGLWTPHRVTLDDSGVLIQAVIRRVRIPWEELRTVEPPLWDVRHDWLKWRRSRGLAVKTPQIFPDLHRMLIEIEQRAPHVHVSS